MNMKKIASVVLALALSVSVFAACGSNGNSSASSTASTESSTASTDSSTASTDSSAASTDSSAAATGDKIDVLNQSETMDVSVAVMTGFTAADSRVQKELEEKYNVKFNLVVLPGWADGQSQISLLMASNDMPNIMWWWTMDTEYNKWVKAGLLDDVSAYMDKYTVIRDYYNKMDPKTLFYASEADGSIYRIPGDVAEPSCENLWIRQDWLDNLNLKAPTTIEELNEVLRAFTEDDPDGNGQNDTYGLGGDGYDFRSFWPWIQSYDQTHYSRFCVDDNGVVTYGPANEGTKNWVSDVADLYAKGYITPNITQDTDRDEQMANGGFGVTYSWCAWNNPDSAPMMSFYASNPDAKWVPIDMVKGSNGNPQEDPATSAAWAYFAITNTASDPERLYATWDDMCDSDNYIARRFGIEGTDYKYDENGQYVAIVGPDSEENTSKNIGLKLFDNLMNRKDECNISNTPETTALFNKSGENSRYAAAHLVEWKDPASFESWTECSADIEAEKDQYLWGVIAGQESIDDWDNYVATLNSLGLEDVLAEANEDYAELSAQMEEYLAAHGEA